MKPIVACLNSRSRRDGAAMLATVIGLVVIFSIYTAGVFAYVGTQRRAVANQMDVEQAFTVAEAGVEQAAAHIQQHHGIVASTVYTNGNVSGSSNQYNTVIVPLSGHEFRIFSTGTVCRTTWTGSPISVSRVVTVNRVWLPSWSRYAMWMHDNNKINFVTGELINGAVHSDNEIYFSGTPRFTNSLVTSATNTWYADGTKKGSLKNVQFDPRYGFKTNTTGGSLASVPFDDLETLAGTVSNGIVIPSETRVDFSGTNLTISTNSISATPTNYITTKLVNAKLVTTTNWYYPTNWYVRPLTNAPQLIYVQGDTYVAGSNGQRVTIVADGEIHITNNLTYSSGTNTTSGEALGLISKTNVWVDESCPTNMFLFAHVMATGDNSGFGAFNYAGRPGGTLTLFGGLVQNERLAVGSGAKGYKKLYTYDTRFVTNPPPYYPVQSETINYEQWEEHAP